MNNKKFIITGGGGFIGSHLTERLLELGAKEVIIIDNESSNAFKKNNNPRVKNYKFDICDYENIRSLFNGVECVFHLAAEINIQAALLNPTLTTKTNILGSSVILQCVKESGVKRVILSSTSAIYGLKNKIPNKESMSDDCLNPYSVTKKAAEDLFKMYNSLFGVEVVIFRYFNVFGEGQQLSGQYAPVIGTFLKQKSDKKPMTIVGDGLQKRDFVYVKDVVEANILASNLYNKLPVGEIINIGSGESYSVLELAKIIGGKYKHIPERKSECKETLADIRKAKKLLNWKPKIKLKNWIEKLK